MKHKLSLDEAAIYQIRVQGRLGKQWGEYLGDLDISVTGESDQVETILSGQVIDQAALIGILNSLYDLGYPLLSVDYQLSP